MRTIMLALLFLTTLFADEVVCHRIQAHLIVKDYRKALLESEAALKAFPEAKEVQAMRIMALALSGEDRQAIQTWVGCGEREELIETVSWGVIDKGSELLNVDMTAMMGAALTRDVRATLLLKRHLQSSSALMRLMAVRLSVEQRDQILIDELVRMLKTEPVWYVRLEVMSVLGKMQVKEAEEPLRELLLDERASFEEKLTAIEALAYLLDEVDEVQLRRLAKNKRAPLRELSAMLIGHMERKDLADVLEELCHDSAPFVRYVAVRSLGWMGKKAPLAEDTHPLVDIMIGYVNRNMEKLEQYLYAPRSEFRRFAAFAVSHVGKEGWKVAYRALMDHPDLYVRVNLALGILGQQVNQARCLEVIDTFLRTEKKKIMWEGGVIAPSEVGHRAEIPQYPSMVDQLTRLDLINTLAMFRAKGAQETAREFLKRDVHGVTFAAAMMLAKEGEGDLVEILSPLLKENDVKIRVQAALVLALFGEEGEALTVLQKAYPCVDRTTKINILASLGYLGRKESIPFLTEVLKEPFQVLRVIAASSLIQCLYH